MPSDNGTALRQILPAHLRNTYDDVLSVLYGGAKPKRSVRADVCAMCVESFDCAVNLIAASPYCIADLMQIPHDDTCKREHRRDCAVCIRSHIYRKLLDSKKEETSV